MSVFPDVVFDPIITITPYSLESLGTHLNALGGKMSGIASTVQTAQIMRMYPFVLYRPIVVTQMFACNGSAVAGNIDVGILSSDFTRIVNMGATAQSGTSQIQAFNITDTELGAGVFYMAYTCTSASATLMATSISLRIGWNGYCYQNSQSSIPATATPVSAGDSAMAPVFGLTTRSFI